MGAKHWEVTLEGYGTARVEAVDKLRAICAAAKGWGLRWTDMARACTVEEIPAESPAETASLGSGGGHNKTTAPEAEGQKPAGRRKAKGAGR